MRTLFFVCWLSFLSLSAFGQDNQPLSPRWYVYSMNGQQIGRAAVAYQNQGEVVQKKKLRYRSQGTVSYEEYTAVLNRDLSLCSVSLKTMEQGQNPAQWVISVSDRIVIQGPQQVVTLPGQKLYLEMEDWLRALWQEKPVTGKVYQGALLASGRDQVTRAKARYMGAVELPLGFYTYPCHAFKVITQELKNFWAEAWLDRDGNLVSYRLGSFLVLPMPPYWQAEYEAREPIAAPVIFDVADIQRMRVELGDLRVEIPRSDYQKLDGGHWQLLALPAPRDVAAAELGGMLARIPDFRYASLHHPLLLKTLAAARGQATTAVPLVRNIVAWVHHHMVAQQTPAGAELATAFAFVPESPALVTVALCRLAGIPARVTAGLRYQPGRFVYTCWPEVYIKSWHPLHYSASDPFAGGASFLALLHDTTWVEQKQSPSLTITIASLLKKGRLIDLAQSDSCVHLTATFWGDWLLGICCDRPASWNLTDRDLGGDVALWHSGNGQLIVCKVFSLPKPLEEVLAALQKKMGEGGEQQWQVLWQARRDFAQGSGLELALKAPSNSCMYRAFLAEKGSKGVLLLLIAAPEDLPAAEKALLTMTTSLRLEVP